MKNDPSIAKDISSIKRALWIILAVLLIQMGLNLDGLSGEPFAEVIMLAGFWAGVLILISMFVRMLIGLFLRLAETAREEDDSNSRR